MQVTIRSTGDLKAVNRALKQAADGKQLRKNLNRELGAVTGPMVAKVKAAWRSAPSKGHASSSRARRGQPDLRVLLAKATRAEKRLTGKQAGVRVRTDGRKMPDRMKALPGYAEGIRRRPWRHQVFGDRETWVTQQPFPRFYQAVQPDEARARQQTIKAVAQVLDQIARAR
jgi:hypothetical protein